MGLCLALVFSVSSVEAQEEACTNPDGVNFTLFDSDRCDGDMDCFLKNNGRCKRSNRDSLDSGVLSIDCDDNFDDPLNLCGGEAPPDPVPPNPNSPRIAVVSNSSGTGSTAVGRLTEELGGIYTKVSIRNFNRWGPDILREKFDVLHIQWGSGPSIRVSWTKLLAFMHLGGGIFFEDPNNIEEIDGLGLALVELHTTGGPAIVSFAPSPKDSSFPEMYDEPEEILSAFTASSPEGTPQGGDDSGYFALANGNCADDPDNGFTGPTRGLGYGCFVNNHITFDDVPGFGLEPFQRLVGSSPNVVGLYGEFTGPTGLKGRILFKGIDDGFHGGGGGTEFQANHYCALTNDIIWVSQLADSDQTNPKNLVSTAREDCVRNVLEHIDSIGPE